VSPGRTEQEFLGRLASLVSHELRTPLTVIAGYAELLDQRDDAATRQEAVGRIRQATALLSAMIDDLLCAAELEAGILEPLAEPLDLSAELAEGVGRLARLESGCVFAVGGATRIVVDADPNHVRHALSNVLMLACGDGHAVEATVALMDGFGTVTLRGGAEPPHEAERARSLSLSVARRLVELNGGRLTLDGGFRLALPLERPRLLAARLPDQAA
jgi:signal transduction histidine kinase